MNHIHAIAAAVLVFGLGASGVQLFYKLDARQLFAHGEASAAPPAEDLSLQTAAKLIRSAVEQHPVVVRLRMGDVVIVDSKGLTAQDYDQLARAKLIELNQCRFPGLFAGPRRVCHAALAESARSHMAGLETPMKIVEVTAPTVLPSTTVQFVDLVVARPKLVDVIGIRNGTAGEKIILYRLRFEATSVAEPLGVSESTFPIEGEIHLRRTKSTWRIED